MYYKGYFPSHSESWRRSMLCRIAGALSVWSSEASTFLITLITIDRYLGIKYTFGNFRLGAKSARIATALLWVIACGIAVAVFVLSEQDSDTYAVSEICVGLPISRKSFHMINKATITPSLSFENQKAQMSMFIYVRQITKQSGRSSNLNEEIRMSTKMSLIVLTEICCWVPVGILSILVQTGMVVVDPVAYAWIATFVLPINSSINHSCILWVHLHWTKWNLLAQKLERGQKRANKCRWSQFLVQENKHQTLSHQHSIWRRPCLD